MRHPMASTLEKMRPWESWFFSGPSPVEREGRYRMFAFFGPPCIPASSASEPDLNGGSKDGATTTLEAIQGTTIIPATVGGALDSECRGKTRAKAKAK